MQTQSNFYIQKLENEKQLLKCELEIVQEIQRSFNGSGLLKSIVQLPQRFDGSSTTSSRKSTHDDPFGDNLLQDGIHLYKSGKEVVELSQKILKSIKS